MHLHKYGIMIEIYISIKSTYLQCLSYALTQTFYIHDRWLFVSAIEPCKKWWSNEATKGKKWALDKLKQRDEMPIAYFTTGVRYGWLVATSAICQSD